MERSDPKYSGVTNWSLVHALIKACVAADAVLDPYSMPGDAGTEAKTLLADALKGVDEAHALAEKYAAQVAEFQKATLRDDDTLEDGDYPLISESDNDDDGKPEGIWISASCYVDLTED